MEGILKVTPEQLIYTANDFSAKGNEIRQLTSEMMNMVTSMAGVWEGEASNVYLGKFRGLQDDMERMFRMVQEHVTDLNEMASKYMQAENENVNDFGSLSSDVIV